jgi:hypothetical protein
MSKNVAYVRRECTVQASFTVECVRIAAGTWSEFVGWGLIVNCWGCFVEGGSGTSMGEGSCVNIPIDRRNFTMGK